MSNATEKRKPQLTVRTSRDTKEGVVARLQGLFPTSPNAPSGLPSSSSALNSEPILRSNRLNTFLKVRILTWNMHDSVPKGDLEELFGKVPSYHPPSSSSSARLPQFNADSDHPYHLILVAGQECPSTSGIPMGLGAGFKLKEDRDKDEKARHSKLSTGPESIKPKWSNSVDDLETPTHHTGWTSMVEDWLCHGGSIIRATTPTTSDISIPKPLTPFREAPAKKGPYQLLCKERLLGIYLAMYVHRDVKPFVESTSKAFVPAGLMGGRWGNKGGVGISAKIDGKTFLFLNCHLAAQVEKANLHDRLNNYNKIKAELSVDDYLASDDPRVMAEDLTDKFDYTFVFGDLNFRLDISRLHADWLISRQDYAQALAFDQLKNLMELGRAFVGFKEAKIEFPPTFKYDVLRTIKRHKHRPGSRVEKLRYEKSQRLTDVEEKELTTEAEGDHDEEDVEAEKESDGEGDGEGEAASLASSVWTSMHSRAVTENEQEEDYFGLTANVIRSASAPGSRASLAVAAQKAKTKWKALLSPTVPTSPTKWLKRTAFFDQPSGSVTKLQKRKNDHSVEDLRLGAVDSEISPDATSLHTHRSRVNSSRSQVPSDDDEMSEEDKGVYDSSHKKRVPSWCDRILFKSTVQPDPETESEEPENPVRPRTKVGQFLANAFRPLSARRRESYSSISSFVHSVTSSVSTQPSAAATPKGETEPSSPIHSPDLLEEVAPFSRFVYGDNENLPAEPMTAPPNPNALPAEADSKLQRSLSASSRHRYKSNNPERNPRRASTSAPILAPDSSPYNKPTTETSPTPSKWRFFPFRHHNPTGDSTTDVLSASTVVTAATKPPRKGDVICLSYDTLDDKGMRHLEGRSDHRPVIGSYAVYI